MISAIPHAITPHQVCGTNKSATKWKVSRLPFQDNQQQLVWTPWCFLVLLGQEPWGLADALKDIKNVHRAHKEPQSCPAEPRDWRAPPAHSNHPQCKGAPAPHRSDLDKVARTAALGGRFVAKSKSSVSVSSPSSLSATSALCVSMHRHATPNRLWGRCCLCPAPTCWWASVSPWHTATPHNWV